MLSSHLLRNVFITGRIGKFRTMVKRKKYIVHLMGKWVALTEQWTPRLSL